MTAVRLVRVRKARRASTLACGHYVLTGKLIVHRDHRWICLDCAIAAIRPQTRLRAGKDRTRE